MPGRPRPPSASAGTRYAARGRNATARSGPCRSSKSSAARM